MSVPKLRLIAALLLGALLAAAAQILALMLSGAGHGRTAPLFFSRIMWIMLPLMAVRLKLKGERPWLFWLDLLTLLIGVLLDALLVTMTVENDEPLFQRLGSETETHGKVDWLGVPFVLLWIALWLSWQIGAARSALVRVCRPNIARG